MAELPVRTALADHGKPKGEESRLDLAGLENGQIAHVASVSLSLMFCVVACLRA
jgi:hypothetical protein